MEFSTFKVQKNGGTLKWSEAEQFSFRVGVRKRHIFIGDILDAEHGKHVLNLSFGDICVAVTKSACRLNVE